MCGFIFARGKQLAVKPVLQALLLADRVYQDVTGKKIIAGTFNRLLFSPKLHKPREVEVDGVKRQMIVGGMHAGSPYAFFSLTDVRGRIPCVLRYVDLEDDKVLLQAEFEVHCDDPLRTVEGVVPMPPLPATKAGVFALELLCGDEPIGSLRVIVEEIDIKDDDNAND